MKIWIYKHYKGKLYDVIWFALHTETREKLVLYKALYDIEDLEKEFWKDPYFVRPYKMFIEEIDVNWFLTPRFKQIWTNKYSDV